MTSVAADQAESSAQEDLPARYSEPERCEIGEEQRRKQDPGPPARIEVETGAAGHSGSDPGRRLARPDALEQERHADRPEHRRGGRLGRLT